MSSDEIINKVIHMPDSVVEKSTKKLSMSSDAKEFVPKNKLIDDDIGVNEEGECKFETVSKNSISDNNLLDTDYTYSDSNYIAKISCANKSDCVVSQGDPCIIEEAYNNNNNNSQTGPARPTSLHVGGLGDTTLYHPLNMHNQPIYTMEATAAPYALYGTQGPSYAYTHIGGQDPSNYVVPPVLQTSPSPVVIQQVNPSSIEMFQSYQNSGGSSPHSYQSVSPPILTGTNNGPSSTIGGEHYVMVHVNLGETFSIRVGDQIQNISGPATVRMVSNSGPPTPMPMQVPPGHMVQQIVDENGILTHVILSPLHQTTQCLGPHAQHLHQTNPQSTFYPPGQNNGSMPLYSNNYNIYNNGMNISQSQNVNNSSQGIIATTKSSVDNGLLDQTNKLRVDPLGKEKSGHSEYNGTCQNNVRSPNNYSDSKPRPSKTRSHQYHHPSQIDEPNHYVKPRTSYTVSSLVSDVSIAGDVNHHQDKSLNNTGYNNHSHYSKIRKKRPFTNSASANMKHHYAHDQASSPQSSADEATSSTILTDEEKKAIRDILNNIEQPEVSQIEARSALIHIIAPTVPENCVATINPADFTFQLHFAERNPDSRFNCVFYGEAFEISLQDLKPATIYYVKVCCTYENIIGNLSQANKFTTLSAEPNQPKPVQLQSKTRNSVILKWNLPIENGSKITEFVVDYCKAESNNDNYISGYRGSTKTCKISKLKPSTEYLFRLAAINSHGQSPWSDSTSITTTGTAPQQPDPPTVARADIGGLLLTWNKRPADDTFCLEMMDEATGYGFITVFNGPEVEHYVENLRRNTSYRFHLAATNQDGRSKWSDVVTISTKPDLPSQPLKLHVRGKINPTQFVLVWDPPDDDGGLAVISYKLELDITTSDTVDSDSDRDWVLFYEGVEREYLCKGLTPGSAVLARVSAKSSIGGWGAPCVPITVKLTAMPPAQMLPPRKDIGNKGKGALFTPGGINILWERPENDGGATIINYELCQYLLKSKSKVSQTSTSNQSIMLEEYLEESEEQVVYSGSQLHCQISGLIPGAQYRYRVRATNKAGNSKWSNPLDATSGPSAPEGPSEAPTVLCKSPNVAVVSWVAPILSNGSQITEYLLEMTSKSDNADFQLIYNGPNLSYEVKNLHPDCCYKFRVRAQNRAGLSPYSPVCETVTPASVPGPVTSVRASAISMNSIQLQWKEAPANGSAINNYSIEITNCSPPTVVAASVATIPSHLLQDLFTVSSETIDKVIGDLLPDTTYKFRIQAINSVGCGVFSSVVKASTLSPPPAPPRLECVNVQSNSIKVRWHNDFSGRQYYVNRLLGTQYSSSKPSSITLSHGASEHQANITQYQLQMSRHQDSGWSNVYTGSLQFHKLGKLLESTAYYLRIMASNDIGDGDFSEPFLVVTEKAAPPPVRPPKVIEKTADSCLIEWPAIRSMNYDPIVYILQLLTISEKDCDYKQVYRGSETSYRLSNLSTDTEYMTRVCAVRLCSPSTIEPDKSSSDSPIHLQKDPSDMGKSDRSSGKIKESSSPVTELLGAFSKSVPFTTDGTRHNNGQSLSSSAGTNSDKPSTSSSRATVQLPRVLSRLMANIGPLSDNHVIALLLILFTSIVLCIAHYIQPYLK